MKIEMMYSFFAITPDPKWLAKEFVQKYGFDFKICPESRYVMELLDIYAWPTHVVLDKKGIVRLHNMTYNPQLSVFWVSDKMDQILSE